MSIVKWDPENLESANTVQVDSDAPSNHEALREIEEWAAERGFVRVNEYWLRQVLVTGQRRFRGVCYRISAEERAAAVEACKSHSDNLERMQLNDRAAES